MNFSYYYDTRPTVPYLFISDLAQDKVEQLFQQFIKEGVPPSKLMIAQYAANDGKKYEFLIRFPFDANGRKPEESKIEEVIKSWEKNPESQSTTIPKPTSSAPASEKEKIWTEINGLRSANDSLVVSLQKLSAQLEMTQSKMSSFEKMEQDLSGRVSSIMQTMEKLISPSETESLAELREQMEELREAQEQFADETLEIQILLLSAADISLDKNRDLIGDSTPVHTVVQPPRIIVIGQCKLTRPEMDDIIRAVFFQHGFEEPKKRSHYECHIDKDNDKPKIWHGGFTRLRNGSFDYLIVGPMAHSLKGMKPEHQGWSAYINQERLKTTVLDDAIHRDEITKASFIASLESIIADYQSN